MRLKHCYLLSRTFLVNSHQTMMYLPIDYSVIRLNVLDSFPLANVVATFQIHATSRYSLSCHTARHSELSPSSLTVRTILCRHPTTFLSVSHRALELIEAVNVNSLYSSTVHTFLHLVVLYWTSTLFLPISFNIFLQYINILLYFIFVQFCFLVLKIANVYLLSNWFSFFFTHVSKTNYMSSSPAFGCWW